MNSSTCINSNSESGQKITVSNENVQNQAFSPAGKQLHNNPQSKNEEPEKMKQELFIKKAPW